MVDVPQDLVERLTARLRRELLSAGPERGLRGTDAARLIQEVEPGFSVRQYGLSLRQLIARSIPEISVIGRSGLDVVYGLAEWAPIGEPSPAELWRTWTSPSSPNRLLVLKGGETTLGPRNGTPPAGSAVLEPVDSAAHLRIARDFLEAGIVDAELAKRLGEHLERDEAAWWSAWNEQLRPRHDLRASWLRYRADKLRQLLRQEIHDGVADKSHAEQAYLKITARTDRTRRLTSPPPAALGSEIGVARVNPSDESDEFRKAVLAAVAKFSTAELRAIQVPAGLFYDEIKRNR